MSRLSRRVDELTINLVSQQSQQSSLQNSVRNLVQCMDCTDNEVARLARQVSKLSDRVNYLERQAESRLPVGMTDLRTRIAKVLYRCDYDLRDWEKATDAGRQAYFHDADTLIREIPELTYGTGHLHCGTHDDDGRCPCPCCKEES